MYIVINSLLIHSLTTFHLNGRVFLYFLPKYRNNFCYCLYYLDYFCIYIPRSILQFDYSLFLDAMMHDPEEKSNETKQKKSDSNKSDATRDLGALSDLQLQKMHKPTALIEETTDADALLQIKSQFDNWMRSLSDNASKPLGYWKVHLKTWIKLDAKAIRSTVDLCPSYEKFFNNRINHMRGAHTDNFTTCMHDIVVESTSIGSPANHLLYADQSYQKLFDRVHLSSNDIKDLNLVQHGESPEDAATRVRKEISAVSPAIIEILKRDYVCSLAMSHVMKEYPLDKGKPINNSAFDIIQWLANNVLPSRKKTNADQEFGIRLSYTRVADSNFGQLAKQPKIAAKPNAENPNKPNLNNNGNKPNKNNNNNYQRPNPNKFKKDKKKADKAQKNADKKGDKGKGDKKRNYQQEGNVNSNKKVRSYTVVNSILTSDVPLPDSASKSFSTDLEQNLPLANSDQFQLTGKQIQTNYDNLKVADSNKMELDGTKQRFEVKSSKVEDISLVQTKLDANAIPGGGKRVTLLGLTPSNEEITILPDSQSSTTLISRKRAIESGFKLVKSNFPVRMDGIGGSEIKRLDYTVVKIKIIDNKTGKEANLAMPAYVVDKIPGDADLLIGMDQMGPGRLVGLNIPRNINDKISVSVGKTKSTEEVTFNLIPDSSGSVFVNEPDSISIQLNSGRNNETGGSALQENKLDMEVEKNERTEETKSDETHTLNPEGKEEEIENPDGVGLPHVKLTGNEPASLVPKLIELNMVIGEIKKVKDILESVKGKIERINNALDSGDKYTNGRKSSLKIQRADLKAQKQKESECLTYLINVKNILSQEIKRELNIIQHRLDKKKRRLDDKEIAEKIKSIPRYPSRDIRKSKTKKSEPSIREIAMSILDEIQHSQEINSDDRSGTCDEAVLARSALDLAARTTTWKSVEDPDTKAEIVSIITASLIEESQDDSKVAEWRDGSLENGEEKFYDDCVTQYHHLSGALNSEFQKLRVDYSDVLVPNDNDIPMGQATHNGNPIEFDAIELVPGGMERLRKKKRKAYPTKKPEEELLHNTIADMEAVGVGESNPINFDSEIASPAFFVFQKGKKRFCVDYRDVNAETKEVIFPIPNIDNILESMLGKKYFSIIDLKSGYHQFKLSKRAMKLAANITTAGIFRYNVLTFGLKNAPAFFQKFMTSIFKDLIGVCMFVYIDDIIIFSETAEQHLLDIEKVLKRLKKCNLKANMNKCHFFAAKIKCLGKIITQDGIAPDPELIQAMVDFPVPKTKTKVRSFLGLVGHYMHFIENFQALAQPLRDLTHDKIDFDKEWKDEVHLKLFEQLKACMLKAPILAYPDYKKPFFIQSDASKFGGGGILFQLNENNQQQVISYASWTFDRAQRAYHTSEREFLALIKCVKKWKAFFWGRKISIESDHEALKGVLNVRDPYGRIARWFALLSQFNYEVNYIKGTDNIAADVMSRTYGDLDDNKLAELEAKCYSMRKEVVNALIEYNGPSEQEYIAAQREDKEIIKYIRYLESNELPDDNKEALRIVKDSDNFIMMNKIIYRNTKIEPQDIQNSPLIWIPDSMRKQVLIEAHDSLWEGAHMGREKTIDKIKKKYYFRNIPKFVDLWVRTCSICNRTKRRHPRNHQTAIGEIEVTKPWDLICIDIWQPGCKSNLGNEYVLTVVDAFTKYAWAIAIPNEKSKTIAFALLSHVLSKFPQFGRIHSDRGENFIGEIMTHLYDMTNTKKSQTTPYHPQSNTYAERIHQFFKNAITSYVNRNQRDWDIVLTIVLKCYLDAKHESLDGLSPAQMVFGRPLGGDFAIPLVTKSKKEYVQRLNLALLAAQKAVAEQVDIKRSNKKITEVKHKSNLKAGDLVGIKVRRIPDYFESNKLYIRYKGPFVISRVTHEGRVIRVIDPISGEEDPTPISNAEVKRFYSRKGTILEEESSSEDESFELTYSSGIDEVDSVDDYHISDDQEEELGEKRSYDLRSKKQSKPKNILAEKSDDIVQEATSGHRSILVQKTNVQSQKSKEIDMIDPDEDYSYIDEDDLDIMGNPYYREELSLFIHTYI